VRKVTGKRAGSVEVPPGINADSLNQHYSRISTDPQYSPPIPKASTDQHVNHIGEFQVFKLLDTLKTTASGLDDIPYWFLRLSAPILALPLSILYNISLTRSEVPKQWMSSIITPVQKITNPKTCADFRPISVTPILSRLMEKIVVKNFLYPILNNPTSAHLFHDQYAFRPTGSTTSALISLFHHMSNLLQNYPFVHLIALDFSKAFDTVRHSTLLQKFANLPIKSFVHNWLMNFLENRTHCTKFENNTSTFLPINASIVQGSGIGPVAYVITASDLQPCHKGDLLNKYADDSYLIVPSVNSKFVPEELAHISKWALDNNLTLNVAKTKEMIVRRPRGKKTSFPPEFAGITRVASMNILGVIFQENFTFELHVDRLVAKGAQTMYAIRTLRHHGLGGHNLWDVARSTLLSRLTYASQAWWGLLDAGEKSKLQGILNKAIKQGLLPLNHSSFSDLCNEADQRMFSAVLGNPNHVLSHLLPPVKQTKYNLRPRVHNREIPADRDTLFRNTYLMHMLYLDSF
jgi:hypothetical protein